MTSDTTTPAVGEAALQDTEVPPPETWPGIAAAMQAAAAALSEQAERDRGQAGALLAAAEAEAARVLGEARAAAQVLTKGADAAAHQAGSLADRARWLGSAISAHAGAVAASERAEALQAERERLGEQIAALDGQAASTAAARSRLAADLGEARSRADVAALAEAKSRQAALDDLAADLAGRRERAARRAWEIAEGAERGELHAALAAADGAHATVRRIANDVWPGSSQAIADRARAELADIIAGQRARLAAEAAGQAPRVQVIGGR